MPPSSPYPSAGDGDPDRHPPESARGSSTPGRSSGIPGSSSGPLGSSSGPPGSSSGTVPGARGPNALIWRWWNLLLLLPLLMLITPWFNKDRPRLFGLPFFYWYQLAFVFVGVACVSIVYAATRTPSSSALPPPVPVSADDDGTTTQGRDR